MANKYPKEVKELLKHVNMKITKDIEDYAINTVFLYRRYIFTQRIGKQQYCYCTHCHKEFYSNGLKHNKKATCPHCRSNCIVKASGYKRKRLVDTAYFVFYEKSVIDPNVVVAKGIYARRDFRNDYKNVKTEYFIEAIYIFKMGKSYMLENSWYYKTYVLNKSVYSLAKQSSYCSIPYYCSINSMKKAVIGTPFQYSTYENYLKKYGDYMVEFFDLYSKYPCIEYLTKLGMSDVVMDKLFGRHTYNAVNWNGKTINKVLKLNKHDINKLRQNFNNIDCELLKFYQLFKLHKTNMQIEDFKSFYNKYSTHIDSLKVLTKYTSFKRIDSYINKQLTKYEKKFYGLSHVLRSWIDYIDDCEELEMNLSNEYVLFPKNLIKAHEVTNKKRKITATPRLDNKILKRQVSLRKYCFQHGNLFIRPAQSCADLIMEGDTLNHCVANNYTEKYANGYTNILFIRKLNEPDTPYYTVEIKNNIVLQVQGKCHCEPNNEVKEFMKVYNDKILKNIRIQSTKKKK